MGHWSLADFSWWKDPVTSICVSRWCCESSFRERQWSIHFFRWRPLSNELSCCKTQPSDGQSSVAGSKDKGNFSPCQPACGPNTASVCFEWKEFTKCRGNKFREAGQKPHYWRSLRGEGSPCCWYLLQTALLWHPGAAKNLGQAVQTVWYHSKDSNDRD